MKYGLTRVLPDSMLKGIRTDAKVICSQQAHFVQRNASAWMGLGMDNIVHVRTDVDTNEMDVGHLEEILKDFAAKKIPVATVVCTMGTTDASAIDPIGKVRKLLDRYPNPEGYGKAVLYADAVVGWSWVYFKDYDFEKNPLEFSERILPILKKNGQAMAELSYADAVGIDFHKVGWAPYVSSCFLYKNAEEFEKLHHWAPDAYLQVRTPYNPMYYTLEVSRTASGSLAGWATLKYFGKAGMQAILGGILETKYYLYDLLAEQKDMVCVNLDDSGLITLFRVYPKDVDARVQRRDHHAGPVDPVRPQPPARLPYRRPVQLRVLLRPARVRAHVRLDRDARGGDRLAAGVEDERADALRPHVDREDAVRHRSPPAPGARALQRARRAP